MTDVGQQTSSVDVGQKIVSANIDIKTQSMLAKQSYGWCRPKKSSRCRPKKPQSDTIRALFNIGHDYFFVDIDQGFWSTSIMTNFFADIMQDFWSTSITTIFFIDIDQVFLADIGQGFFRRCQLAIFFGRHKKFHSPTSFKKS